MIEIVETLADDLETEFLLAKQEEKKLLFPKTCTYFKVYHGLKEIGFCGIQVGKTVSEFKADYIRPRFRKTGAHLETIKLRIKWMDRFSGPKRIKAVCTEKSFRNYIRSGFAEKKRFKGGLTEVELCL